MIGCKCHFGFQPERGLIIQLCIMELAVSLRVGNRVLRTGSYGIMFGVGKSCCVDQA